MWEFLKVSITLYDKWVFDSFRRQDKAVNLSNLIKSRRMQMFPIYINSNYAKQIIVTLARMPSAEDEDDMAGREQRASEELNSAVFHEEY